MRKFHLLGSVALAFSLFFTLGTAATQAQDGSEFAGGNGTEADPWQIATKQQLAAIDKYGGDGGKGKYFILTRDLDFTDDFSRSGDFYNDGKFWKPLCGDSWDADFQGTLDGNNHEIIGLRVNSDQHAGLFAYIEQATIKNLTISYGKVNVGEFGGIAYYASGTSVIENCHVKSDEDYGITIRSGGGLIGQCEKGYVIGSSFVGKLKQELRDSNSGYYNTVGGIVGIVWNSYPIIITDSFVEGDISCDPALDSSVVEIGGMVGRGLASISNCYVKGNISAPKNKSTVGGFFGHAGSIFNYVEGSTTIEKSYFQGNITGNVAGGLIGWSGPDPHDVASIYISSSYADAKIQGTGIVGGLIGMFAAYDLNSVKCCSIEQSYSKGEIEMLSAVGYLNTVAAGGLVGLFWMDTHPSDVLIEDCYSHCNIKVSSKIAVRVGGLVGGLVGYGTDTVRIEIQKSYAMGKIEGDQAVQASISGNHAYVGGLLGQSDNNISILKSVAMNPSLIAPHGDNEDTGRIIGSFVKSDLGKNYALDTMAIKVKGKDVSVTGTASDKNGQNKTSAELAQQSTYTGLGWDFNNIWKMSVNGYPIFIWEEDTPLTTPPTITSQPKSQTVNVGDSVTFSVTATGTEPLNYQWYKNSTAISGATSSSYTINSVTTGDAGSYYVIVSNSIGSATSSVATLTVNAPASAPVIVTQPVSQTVDVGQSVRFSVVAIGTEPLNYQWLKNGATIPDATSASYTISSAKMEDAGNYMVIVSNSAGVAVSNSATLTVKDPAVPPVIIVQPMSQEVLIGESVTFSVVATGTEPLSYQWLFNGNPIPGATGSTYSISQVTEAHAGNYSVIVSNVAGTVISSTAVLTVKILPPVIVMHPQTQIIMKGSTATFAVIAEGYGLSYQWTFNGKDIAGANQPVYMIPAAEAVNVGSYAVKVSNKAGSVTSQSAMLWLNNLQMYAGVEVYGPIGAKFTVWYKDDAESGEWKKLTSSTVSASPTVVIDYDSPQNKKRFYKVEIE